MWDVLGCENAAFLIFPGTPSNCYLFLREVVSLEDFLCLLSSMINFYTKLFRLKISFVFCLQSLVIT